MRRIVFVSIVFLLAAGCGTAHNDRAQFKGTITYKGQPVNASALLLYPTGAVGQHFTMIPVTQDGTFNSADTPAGDYRIVVQAVPEVKKNMSPGDAKPTIPFPAKYKDINTTDLTCSIKPDAHEPLKLELKD
jgi:hypothetical protein